MTPERKVELKALLDAADGPDWAHDSELMDKAPGIVRDLWAALEEAEKQLTIKTDGIK
ncbi:hypothetical protein [Paenibacillus tepidiphilus]|uniref:hypothetical protein n=1 Tax=Paenibacillus tepidiphilus TaxID=2608683 RepID=UPI0013A5A3F2|nr:hypothetical protein [Paenibacillus tepidiphilus]